MTACIVDNDKKDNKIVFISVYWDGRIKDFPKEALKAIELGRENGYNIIMGGDFNARNVLFGSNL